MSRVSRVCKDRKDHFEVSGSMLVEEGTAHVEQLHMEDNNITLVCGLNDRLFEVVFQIDSSKPPVDGSIFVIGNLPDGRRGVSVNGVLKVSSLEPRISTVDISERDSNLGQFPEFRAGELSFKVMEIRGGFMDRGR